MPHLSVRNPTEWWNAEGQYLLTRQQRVVSRFFPLSAIPADGQRCSLAGAASLGAAYLQFPPEARKCTEIAVIITDDASLGVPTNIRIGGGISRGQLSNSFANQNYSFDFSLVAPVRMVVTDRLTALFPDGDLGDGSLPPNDPYKGGYILIVATDILGGTNAFPIAAEMYYTLR